MNIRALVGNFRRASAWTASIPDALRYVAWVYSGHPLLQRWVPTSFDLHMSYPPPVGVLNVSVRTNAGSDAFVFGEVFHHRCYDVPLRRTPRTILDVGANAGFTAMFFARRWPEAALACIEPFAGNVDILRRNLVQNGIMASVFEAALTSHSGDVEMEVGEKDYGHRIAAIAFGREQSRERVGVQGMSVNEALRRLGWSRIGLMKLDIEGYEGVLLRENCDWLRRVDAICIELHEGFSHEDLRRVAATWGFCEPANHAGIWLMQRLDTADA